MAVFGLKTPQWALVLLFLLIVDGFVALSLNVWVFQRYKDEIHNTSWVTIHIISVCVALFAYVFVGSGFMFWAYKHQHSLDVKEQMVRVSIGVSLNWFLRGVPGWLSELFIFNYNRTFHPLHVVAFGLTNLTFLIGLVFVWLTYAWGMSAIVEKKYAAPEPRKAPRQHGPQQHTTAVTGTAGSAVFMPSPGGPGGGIAHMGYHQGPMV